MRQYRSISFRSIRTLLADNLSLPLALQKILLLWGENDNIFNIELAKTMKE